MSNYPPGTPPPQRMEVTVRCINDDCPTALAARLTCEECGGARVFRDSTGELCGCPDCDGKGWVLDDADRETYEGFVVYDLGQTVPVGGAEECRVCGGEVVLL